MIIQCPIGHLAEHEKIKAELNKAGGLNITLTCEECNRIYTTKIVGQMFEMEMVGSKDQ